MNSRYFVVVSIPPAIMLELKKFYIDNFGTELVAKNLHMSLLPPVYLKAEVSEQEFVNNIKKVKFENFMATLDGLGVFEHNRKKFLYTHVLPKDKCQQLAESVDRSVSGLVEIDTTPYENGVVPEFESHVTLDYDFHGQQRGVIPKLSFVIDKIAVFKGEGGEWVECGPDKIK